MHRSLRIVGGGESGNELRTYLHQSKPGIELGIAPRFSGLIRAGDTAGADIRFRRRVFSTSGIVSGDDAVLDLLRRRYGLAFAYASGDVLPPS